MRDELYTDFDRQQGQRWLPIGVYAGHPQFRETFDLVEGDGKLQLGTYGFVVEGASPLGFTLNRRLKGKVRDESATKAYADKLREKIEPLGGKVEVKLRSNEYWDISVTFVATTEDEHDRMRAVIEEKYGRYFGG